MIVLQVKAKHFKNTDFSDHCGCPLAEAAKEQFSTQLVSEGVTIIDINGVTYSHQPYSSFDYLKNLDTARELDFSDEVIKTIELKTPTP